MTHRDDRQNALEQALSNRILVLDGAMGTSLQNANLTAADFGGPEFEGCNEHLLLTKPEAIASVHESYLEAGADIIETNTFGATALVLAEYGLADKAYRINLAGAKLARECAERYSTKDQPRFVAGSIGPTTKAISVTGGVTFEALVAEFAGQAAGLYDGGVDYYLIETCQDTRNIKAAILGIEEFSQKRGVSLPIAVSATIEASGTMLAGQSVEALIAALAHVPLLYIGLNCATGPELMADHIRGLSALAKTRIACVPNAGLPDADGRYLETPEMVVRVLKRFCEAGLINLLGGCCGTTPAHIRAMAELARGRTPRTIPSYRRSFLSGIDFLEVKEDERPVVVGERTNSIGSRLFKRLIAEGKFDEASDIARAQVKNGAQVIDICLANPDRDELLDVKTFLEFAVKKVRAPLMIDSTDDRVIELALPYSQGKAIINSVNLENGESRFAKIVPLARRFGAALVVGTIDDDSAQGMGVSRERKLSIAKRSYELLTEKYGMPVEDLYFDPLVFPCATGNAEYVGSAIETIEGIRLIKAAFPGVKTVLGISNVSFGLPPAGREILNSVFLHHCVKAGLDLAIVNAEKLERYPAIPQEERVLAEDLLFNRGDDPIGRFVAHFRERAAKVVSKVALPLQERLANYIIEGTKDGLLPDLEEALKTMAPLSIINGPLMTGMAEVGRLFNLNDLIVAEVLQSAEVMKAAVAFLEPHMEKGGSTSRGTMVLATVKGDVHDIGKSLVDIILTNNGFKVIDLGIKIPPEVLIAAVREHKPDLIGLSGLLVKSALQMEATALDLKAVGIETPILVGGAALTERFVDTRISPAYGALVEYAQDAMTGLALAKEIVDPEGRLALETRIAARRLGFNGDALKKSEGPKAGTERSSEVPLQDALPTAPDFSRHRLEREPIELIWTYVNPLMLYGKHLGLKGSAVKALGPERASASRRAELSETEWKKAQELETAVKALKEKYGKTLFKPKAVYQFFNAKSVGNQIEIYDETAKRVLSKFAFPRQAKDAGLCLADYVDPRGGDSIALLVVTAGDGVRAEAERLKAAGEYLNSHALQALALESAEAYAELLHGKIRSAWGFPDEPEMTMMDRFQAKYRGKRYSFGYPACPNLEDQKILFELLHPEEIGVELTEGFMMEPEASVSAMVFHHPAARYFGVGKEG